MNLFTLTLRNLQDSPFRSWIIFLCALLVSAFAVGATLIIGGAQTSLRLALDRLGADIIAVPAGSVEMVENAFLMGQPATTWMPEYYVEQIAQIPGVVAVSPQYYLATLRGATCCSVPEMFLIAYDPETDFTLKPWLESHLEGGLAADEAVGGAYVFLPAGTDNILIYGTPVYLKGNLEATGTGLDQSMFFTFDAAEEIARNSFKFAEQPLRILDDAVSSVMVKVDENADPHEVALAIADRMPEVSPIESTNLFRSQRDQILGLLRSVVLLLVIAWTLAVALIGLLFSIAVNERRREIGVLRALGATRAVALRSLLAEGLVLALVGGSLGAGLTVAAVYLFRNFLIDLLGVPFYVPGWGGLLLLALGGLALAAVSVVLAALLPAMRISSMDPAIAMRE